MAVALELQPPIVVRVHASGAAYGYPLGDPELVCRGDSVDEVLSIMTMFLAEHLGRIAADHLAGFAYPADTVLHDIPVTLAREDLGRRFGVDGPVAVPCVAVPDGEAWWVHVLPLRHVVHVAPGEDLQRRAIDEITRYVAARELTPAAWAALLPAHEHLLRRITVTVRRHDRDDLGSREQLRRSHEGERSRTEARALLEQVGEELLAKLARRRPPPAQGREHELARVAALLSGDQRTGVALVGPALAGKTAVLEALLAQQSVPFRARPVFATSGAALVAGQSGFGELAERVHAVMGAAELLDAILYFDNLGDLFAGKSGGIEDLASALRPWLVDGRVRIVGECTAEAFEQYEKQHATLLACLHRVGIEPLSAELSRTILLERNRHARRNDAAHPAFDESAIAPLVELCERYLVDEAFPGKAVRMFDELRAIHRHDVDDAGKPHVIGVGDVYRAFSLRTGMPMFLLRDDERLRRATLEHDFGRRIIGQREAIAGVVETLCTVKARLQPPGKPLANFLFVGPTGVGKTEVAKTLARILFGGPDRMVRFDMSEYTDPWAAERLIRGTASDDGELTRRVRQQPFSVVLLDEIEKAHPVVFDLLLQVLGEGRLTDGRGHTTHFGNTIVIMTSNLGASHRPKHGGGAGFAGDAAPAADFERRYYLEQVDRHFRPEFVNRIDRIIPFASLDRAEIAEVARVSLQRIRERAAFVQRGIELLVSDAALATLATRGYSASYGARALRRHLEDHLVAPLARLLSQLGALADRGRVQVRTVDEPSAAAEADVVATAEHDGVRFTVNRAAQPRHVATGVAYFSQLRRNAAAAVRCARIDELRQRVAYLTAELAGTTAKAGHGASVPAALLEHRRLSGALARLDAALASLESTEELAIEAAAEGGSNEALHELAATAHAELELAFVAALFEGEPHHGLTLSVLAPAGPEPLHRWLGWLAGWAEARKWQVTLHAQGDRGTDWPSALPWGPPRALPWIREQLARADAAPWRALLVRVDGPHAGAVLALEAGLHRLWPADRATADHLEIAALTWRTALGQAELAADGPLAPPRRSPADQLHRLPAAREVFADGVVALPQLGFTSRPGCDLADADTPVRLWFGELVRRAREGLDVLPELPD